MPTINVLLALVALALMLVLIGILVRRRLYRRFGIFFAYCVWTLVVAIMRFSVRKHPLPYFVVYWLTESSYFVLAFFAILSLLRPFIAVLPGRALWHFFLWTAWILLIGTSLWFATFGAIEASALGRFVSGIYVFVPMICLLEVMLAVVVLIITPRYSIGWSRYEAGILAGFGLLALMTLVADLPTLLTLLHWRVSPQVEALFRYFPSGAFISSAIAWLITFWHPEPPTTYDPPVPPSKYRELARIQQEGLEALRQLAKRLGLHRADIVMLPPGARHC